jgi:hypothetical protein
MIHKKTKWHWALAPANPAQSGLDAGLFGDLIRGLSAPDPWIAFRAADAAEKASRQDPALLAPHERELLRLLAGTQQPGLRWHLSQMVPRLRLTVKQRRLAARLLQTYLGDRSSIVKTCAIQGLFDLSTQDAGLRPMVAAALSDAARNGTPAMRARARKLTAETTQKSAPASPTPHPR